VTTHRFGEFAVAVDFDSDRTVLEVGGEVDMLTAPTLSGLLGVLVDQGHPNLLLDLAALTFLDAAGLGVIVAASSRLQESGRLLTLRSVPAQTQRILDLTGVSELVQIDTSDPNVTALGAEQRSGDHSRPVASASADLSSDLARIGSVPASNAVIDAALRLVTALASDTVEGADGVSVSLERHGRVATVASSNQTVQRMDDHQYETGEGPCLAAAAEGRWFHIEALAEENRWPAFVPLAIEEGIASILSTPLMVAERPLGALNIYSNTERAFGPHQQELAALFATQASQILADAAADVTDEQMAKRFAAALAAREVIAQAQGVLMARHNITAAGAAASLRRAARTAEVPVRSHAATVVASTRNDADPTTA